MSDSQGKRRPTIVVPINKEKPVGTSKRSEPPAAVEEVETITQHDLQILVMYRRMLRHHRRMYEEIGSAVRRKIANKAEIEDGVRNCELAEYVIRGRKVTRLVID